MQPGVRPRARRARRARLASRSAGLPAHRGPSRHGGEQQCGRGAARAELARRRQGSRGVARRVDRDWRGFPHSRSDRERGLPPEGSRHDQSNAPARLRERGGTANRGADQGAPATTPSSASSPRSPRPTSPRSHAARVCPSSPISAAAAWSTCRRSACRRSARRWNRCATAPTSSASAATSCSAGGRPGFVVGRAEIVERLRRNPLKRALRLDKATIAALESCVAPLSRPAPRVPRGPCRRCCYAYAPRGRDPASGRSGSLPALA